MELIGRDDREKAKRIIDIVDVSRIAERAKDSWGQSHEITELCDFTLVIIKWHRDSLKVI